MTPFLEGTHFVLEWSKMLPIKENDNTYFEMKNVKEKWKSGYILYLGCIKQKTSKSSKDDIPNI